MSDPDLREALGALIGDLRRHLQWQQRQGLHVVPATASPRPAGPATAPADPAPAEWAPAESTPAPAGPPGPPGAEPREDAAPAPRWTLASIREDLGDCQRCKLAGERQNIVFGVGAADAPLMFVGEAPGAEEDRRGEPFVGKAGQLLDRMIAAMGWSRSTVYIANVLKCRPPRNRDPEPDEIERCEPFLARQIEAVSPRIIVTLGRPATQLLLRTRAPISSLRGRFQAYRGIKVMPTFHPAFLLRQPERKRDAWDDLKLVIAELRRLGVPSPAPPRA